MSPCGKYTFCMVNAIWIILSCFYFNLEYIHTAAANANIGLTTTIKPTNNSTKNSSNGVKEDIREAHAAPGEGRCVEWGDDFASILQENDQIFIFGAAKAGGSSMTTFVLECMGDPQGKHHRGQFINSDVFLKPFLTSSLEPPKVVFNHILESSEPMMDVMRYASRRTLLIYLYREETDRLMSAIRFVAKQHLCGPLDVSRMQPWQFWKFFPHLKKDTATPTSELTSIKARANEILGILENTESSCTLDELKLLENTIEPQVQEIGFSTDKHLNKCEFWQVLDDNAPRVLFVHYDESDHLQSQLAQQYCPTVPTKRINVGRPQEHEYAAWDDVDASTSTSTSSSSSKYQVRLESNKQVVPLDDWVDAKKSTIEWVLKTSQGGSCKRRTRAMEDAMMSCPNHALFYS